MDQRTVVAEDEEEERGQGDGAARAVEVEEGRAVILCFVFMCMRESYWSEIESHPQSRLILSIT